MLRATFQYIVKGISAEKEASLWKKGVFTWEDFERQRPFQPSLFKGNGDYDEASPFDAPRNALRAGDAAYFAKLLHPREYFRVPLALPDRTVFLDIETTGLSRYYDVITLVGWSYKGQYGAIVRGGDITPLKSVLANAQVVVTFNGALFDLPFLRTGLSDLPIPPVHIDLRFLAKRVGLSGGQKAIEQEVGFKRPAKLADVQGETAPLLWHRYRRGSLDALKLLITYNHADIEGMKYIFDTVVGQGRRHERILASAKQPRHYLRDNCPASAAGAASSPHPVTESRP